jgi:hypothetical protein
MTREELWEKSVIGMAQIVQQVRSRPGITGLELINRSAKRHVCMMYLHMACAHGLIVEKKAWFGFRYHPEDHDS